LQGVELRDGARSLRKALEACANVGEKDGAAAAEEMSEREANTPHAILSTHSLKVEIFQSLLEAGNGAKIIRQGKEVKVSEIRQDPNTGQPLFTLSNGKKTEEVWTSTTCVLPQHPSKNNPNQVCFIRSFQEGIYYAVDTLVVHQHRNQQLPRRLC